MAPRHFPAVAIGVLLAGLVTAGVATVFSRGSAGADRSSVPVPTSTADLVLPMDAYDLTPAQQLEVARAYAELVEECMRVFGHDFRIKVADSTPYPRNVGYITWLGDNQVERYGYGTPPGRVDDPYESRSVSDAEFRVLEGKAAHVGGKKVPVGGCSGAAEGILNAGAPSFDGRRTPGRVDALRLPNFMDDVSWSAHKDPGLHVADAAWAECMHHAGYAYSQPLEAVGDPRWAITAKNDHDPPPQGTPAEIQTAVDDHRCRLETNYYGKRQAIYAAYQQKIIDANPRLFADLRILMDTRLRNARQVNSGAPAVRPWD